MGKTPPRWTRQRGAAPAAANHARRLSSPFETVTSNMTSYERRCSLARRALAMLATLVMALAVVGVGAPVVGAAGLAGAANGARGGAGRAPGGDLSNLVVRRVDIASPAVVRLATIYQAHISLALCGGVVTLPTTGTGYAVGGLGSGVFISAHGDILTAGHVVDIDHASLDQEVFQGAASSQDIASALNAAPCIQFSSPVRAIDVQNGEVQFAGIPYTTNYSAPLRYAWRNTDYTGPITRAPQDAPTTLQGLFAATPIPVTPVAVSDFTRDDVAILHANLTDTPSATLDNSNTVAVMDTLTVIGFPGNGDATYDPTNLLTPSVNTATVSAIKENDDGSTLIQVGGNIEHGDSGGPALDANGNIVGVVSFGGPDPQGVTAFLRSSNSALALIQGASVDMAPGAFERNWQQAFTDYAATYAGHWHKAARELDALASAYPDFHGVAPYQTYADQAAANETLPSKGFSVGAIGPLAIGPLAIGAAVVVLLLLALITVMLVRRRSHRRQPAMLGVATPATSPLSAYTSLPSGGGPEFRPVYPPNPGFPSIPLYSGYGAPGAYSVPLSAPIGQAAPGQSPGAGYPAYPLPPLPPLPPLTMYPPQPSAPTASPQASASSAPFSHYYPATAQMGASAPPAQPFAPASVGPQPAQAQQAAGAFAPPMTAQAPAAPETAPLPAMGVETRPVRVVAPATSPLPAVAPETAPLPIFPAYGRRPQEEMAADHTDQAALAGEPAASSSTFAPVTPSGEHVESD